MKIPERLDLADPIINKAEKILHLARYQWVEKLINQIKNTKRSLLDVACGTGYGSDFLQRKIGIDVMGVDNNQLVIHQAKRQYRQKKLQFKVGNISQLLFKNRFFDYIVCFETIEHLNKKNGLQAMKELYRLLKPGGYLFISCPNPYITNLIKRIYHDYNNPFHLYEYPPEELEKTLMQIGFKIRKKVGQYPFMPLFYYFATVIPGFKFFLEPQPAFPQRISRYYLYLAQKSDDPFK